MGQRSQIYVRINRPDGKYDLIARYFSWNLDTQMVSRARHTIQWIKENSDNASYFLRKYDGYKVLSRIIDVNFDYHDIGISTDIIKEVEDGYITTSEGIFHNDNNDGKLLIDVCIKYDSKHLFDYKVNVKYAFLDCNNELIGDGDEYIKWDSDEPNWRESDSFKKEINFTDRNIRYINKHAKLMTEEEVLEFITHDYISDMELRKENK